MKRILISFFILLLSNFLHAQHAPSNARYDSLMAVLSNRSIPLIDRYYMTGTIEYLDQEELINALKVLVPEAKEYEGKHVVTRLYCLISKSYSHLNDFKQAKAYIDSAFLYEGKFENDNIAGLMYYVRGVYAAEQGLFNQAHDDYYTAAKYFKKRDPNHFILTDVYYNLSTIYALKQDAENLKQLINWMEPIPIVLPAQAVLSSSVKAEYFMAMYHNSKNYAYLDSASAHNLQAIGAYLVYSHDPTLGKQTASNYLLQAEIFNMKQNYDSTSKYLQIGKLLLDSANAYTLLRSKAVEGQLLAAQGEMAKAEHVLLLVIEKLQTLDENQQAYYYSLFIPCYSTLSLLYERQGNYSQALETERKALQYQQLLFNAENNELIQDLKAKYDLDNKQRIVDQLTEINKANKKVNYLLLGVGVLLASIVLLLILRHRSQQKINDHNMELERLRKEEAELHAQLNEEKAVALTARIDEKEREYQLLVNEMNLKQLQSYLDGLEAERMRLSKELHDNISNGLLSIKMMLRSNHNMDSAIFANMLQDIHDQVRTISHQLIPPTFKHASLPEILADFAFRQSEAWNSNIDLHVEESNIWNNMPEKISLEIYRIVQEAVGNALKHGNASMIRINLEYMDGNIELLVEDNGRGFDTNVKSKGIGLGLMQERVTSIRGKLELVSAPNEGTRIRVVIPCN